MIRQQQWDKLFLKFAHDVSQMSRATRLQVGAVAVKDRRVICIGYNGTPEGADNCCEFMDDYGTLVTKSNVVHAEDNLIRFATKERTYLEGCTLYITHCPCPNCCELIVKAGFSRVVFSHFYRDTSGVNNLLDKGIIVDC